MQHSDIVKGVINRIMVFYSGPKFRNEFDYGTYRTNRDVCPTGWCNIASHRTVALSAFLDISPYHNGDPDR